MDMPQTPPVSDQAARRRMEHQRLRWRLLYGQAEQDIEARIRQAIGNIRREMWGPIDMSSNPFLDAWNAASALYKEAPTIIPPSAAEQVVMAQVDSVGWWSRMQRVQRDTLALRECPVFIDWQPNQPLVIRQVPPYMVEVKVYPRRPTQPRQVTEWARDPDAPTRWVRHVYDQPSASYRVYDERDLDVTERVAGGTFEGDSYPWQGARGPILPWVTYHAQDTGWYWDAYAAREVVEGTLQLGVLYSYYSHLMRAASWAQRYVIGAEPVGAEVDAEGGTREVVTDPASLLQLQVSDGSTNTTVGQWQPSADPERVLASVHSYERRVLDKAVGSLSVSRASSDIRSGFSLAVSREDQRALQRSYTPSFRRTDLELLGKIADMQGLERRGWRIEYKSIPQDPTESQAQLDRISKLVDLGLIDRVTAYMELHPAVTHDEAVAAVAMIAATNNQGQTP